MAVRARVLVAGSACLLALTGCSPIDRSGASVHPAGPEAIVVPSASSQVVPTPPRRQSRVARGDQLDLRQEQAGEWPAATPPVSEAPDAGVDPERAIGVIAHSLAVRALPSFDAQKIGFLRVGAVVPREAEPAGFEQCAAGWYRIEPDGYVCVGSAATLDIQHPLVAAARVRPDRDAPLPYVYGMARKPTPPFYVKVPTRDEQQRYEPDLAAHLARSDSDRWHFARKEPVPELIRGGRLSPTVRRLDYPKPIVSLGRARGQAGFALLHFFEAQERGWALDAELEVLPLDRLEPVEPSTFQGVVLDDEMKLPVVFVRTRHAFLYEGTPGRGLSRARRIAYREAFSITGRTIRIGVTKYLETRDGFWVPDERLVRVDAFRKAPGWASPGRTWIDVSILEQSLVAYEGTRAVYATLVSTGVDGIGDPEKTHSTIQGQFLVHTKHVSITMDGDEVGDEFDLRDVPYVQYFTRGYALHAAYWHDSFGQPRSHGCINLSPLDARWLFRWTDPPVPERWHGALSLKNGTLVHIHP